MNILLTGSTGYIGQRLLPALLDAGHNVFCCVRDKLRFNSAKYNSKNLFVVECDFLDSVSLSAIPQNIDVAYYLIHSMASPVGDFENLEKISAENFKSAINKTNTKQVIYLSGIINDDSLSKHLTSRKNVEQILSSGIFKLTTLRAGIIVGSGSASFEIIRDLVEKLPVMITPKWLNTKTQPIAIRNVIDFLVGVIANEYTFGKSFDIGSPDIVTYKEMLLKFAEVRGLKRRILVVPVMTPKLSSYWLFFVTSVSFTLAKNLVNSMKVEIVCKPNDLHHRLNIKLIDYVSAIKLAFEKIEHHRVISSWTDAQTSTLISKGISKFLTVPKDGCYIDHRFMKCSDENYSLEKIFSIGGKNGWYYANWLWSIRGFLDKLFGGVGMRRGRKDSNEIFPGETLDFWKVLIADRSQKRLLLLAEMKLPGEAWLDFKISNGTVFQTATFRPLGLWGRMYWFSVLPFHFLIFNGMLKKISSR